jgi:hypothetical protein
VRFSCAASAGQAKVGTQPPIYANLFHRVDTVLVKGVTVRGNEDLISSGRGDDIWMHSRGCPEFARVDSAAAGSVMVTDGIFSSQPIWPVSIVTFVRREVPAEVTAASQSAQKHGARRGRSSYVKGMCIQVIPILSGRAQASA